MNMFKIGDRVELRSCLGLPGTVIGFAQGKVQVRFDDLRAEPAKALRSESLQFAERMGSGA